MITMAPKNNVLARENRIMIKDIKEDICCIRKDVKQLGSRVEEIFNHMSKRLPGWATILITILGSLVTGLIVASIK